MAYVLTNVEADERAKAIIEEGCKPGGIGLQLSVAMGLQQTFSEGWEAAAASWRESIERMFNKENEAVR